MALKTQEENRKKTSNRKIIFTMKKSENVIFLIVEKRKTK